MAGLITGIVGGIIVGSISGSPLQVSGPAAGLVALVAEIITDYNMGGLGVILLAAGVMQAVCGVLKLGQWFRAISPAVIEGMLAGIGVLIMAGQFHVMLDVKPESNGLANILSIPQSIMKGLFPLDNSTHHLAAMLGVLSIGVVLAWNLMPKRFKLVPGTLVAVIVAVVVAMLTQWPVHFVNIPDAMWSVITLPTAKSWMLLTQPQAWVLAATVAIVASAETMLSASAVEQMHSGPRTKYDQEMVAQGIGNTICGFLGALPMTGVIVRSSANVQAGAQSRWSAVMHGVWLLALVSVFPHILEMIPTASLAAILVYTGYKLVKPEAIRRLWRISKGEVAVYAVTLVMVVSTNLLEGVIAGAILSVLRLLYTLSSLSGTSVEVDGDIQLTLRGSATFLSLPKLVSILERQPLGKRLHIFVDELNHIDHACMGVLQSWETQYNRSGGTLTVEWQALHDKLPGRPVEIGSSH
jgi:MFS superfamily sulfate permease-like transporter